MLEGRLDSNDQLNFQKKMNGEDVQVLTIITTQHHLIPSTFSFRFTATTEIFAIQLSTVSRAKQSSSSNGSRPLSKTCHALETDR